MKKLVTIFALFTMVMLTSFVEPSPKQKLSKQTYSNEIGGRSTHVGYNEIGGRSTHVGYNEIGGRSTHVGYNEIGGRSTHVG